MNVVAFCYVFVYAAYTALWKKRRQREKKKMEAWINKEFRFIIQCTEYLKIGINVCMYRFGMARKNLFFFSLTKTIFNFFLCIFYFIRKLNFHQSKRWMKKKKKRTTVWILVCILPTVDLVTIDRFWLKKSEEKKNEYYYVDKERAYWIVFIKLC